MSALAPRRLILTLYGLYAREANNWLSVSALVDLMHQVGVESASTRSSISRLKRRGVLESYSVNGQAGYTLSDDTLDVLRTGDQRIFDQHRASVEDGFALVVFSVPESQRAKRHQLRSSLAAMGFGAASPGVAIAPAPMRDEAERTLQRRGLGQYVDIFHARHEGFGDLSQRAAQWWDLDAINGEYAEFVDSYADSADRLDAAADQDRAAFEMYVPMLTRWRRLPYRDPGIPAELLPEGWNGYDAHRLFRDLDARMREPAHTHAMRIIHG